MKDEVALVAVGLRELLDEHGPDNAFSIQEIASAACLSRFTVGSAVMWQLEAEPCASGKNLDDADFVITSTP